MGDSRTSLVNTRIALVDAPNAALSLYRRLVDLGAIEAELRDDVAFRSLWCSRFARISWPSTRPSRSGIDAVFMASRSG
jgi:hypothetical protein